MVDLPKIVRLQLTPSDEAHMEMTDRVEASV